MKRLKAACRKRVDIKTEINYKSIQQKSGRADPMKYFGFGLPDLGKNNEIHWDYGDGWEKSYLSYASNARLQCIIEQ